MAHLTTLNPGSSGDTASTTDISLATYPTTGKAQNVVIYSAPNNTTSGAVCTQTNPLYTAQSDGTNNILSGSAANLSAQTAIHAELSVLPGNWAVNAQATAGTPSASKTAGGAGVRHVASGISISVSANATAQTPVIINLRDGATGAGTIVRTWALSAVAGTTASISEGNLNIVGSAATAMTIEFAGASAAAVIASVNLNGFDCV